MLDRKTIKQHAKSVLSANYGVIIGTFAVYSLISLICGMVPYIGICIYSFFFGLYYFIFRELSKDMHILWLPIF